MTAIPKAPADRPAVIWKYGASLDGRIAAADGTSRWITSSESREDAHKLRAACDAVVVGSGTQTADDPHLAVRHVEVGGKQPIRVVIDSNAKTGVDARILDDVAPTIIVVADDADASHLESKTEVIRVSRADAGLNLSAVLKALRARGIESILLEGGPTLAGSFLAAGLIDKVVGYIAPLVIGGTGKSALVGPGAQSIGNAWRLEVDEYQQLGPDMRITAYFAKA